MLDRAVVEEIAELYPTEYDEGRVGSEALSQRLQARGHLERREFLDIVRWKSPRAVPLAKQNPYWRVRIVSAQAFTASFDEGFTAWILCYLKGVSIRMASAIMTAYDPDAYTVLDVRVWGALERLGLLRPLGLAKFGGIKNVNLDSCETYAAYLPACRYLRSDIDVPLRVLDRCLWVIGQRDEERGGLAANHRSLQELRSRLVIRGPEGIDRDAPEPYDPALKWASPAEVWTITKPADAWDLCWVQATSGGGIQWSMVTSASELLTHLEQAAPELNDPDAAMKAVVRSPKFKNAPQSLKDDMERLYGADEIANLTANPTDAGTV